MGKSKCKDKKKVVSKKEVKVHIPGNALSGLIPPPPDPDNGDVELNAFNTEIPTQEVGGPIVPLNARSSIFVTSAPAGETVDLRGQPAGTISDEVNYATRDVEVRGGNFDYAIILRAPGAGIWNIGAFIKYEPVGPTVALPLGERPRFVIVKNPGNVLVAEHSLDLIADTTAVGIPPLSIGEGSFTFSGSILLVAGDTVSLRYVDGDVAGGRIRILPGSRFFGEQQSRAFADARF